MPSPTPKTEKELAFLHDLFVAPDWGERFAELVDEHLVLPKQGEALYVGCGTGGHAIALQERAGADLKITGLAENKESLELARAKAAATTRKVEFRCETIDALDMRNDQFALAIVDGSLVEPQRVPKILSEGIRVTKPGGTVALSLVTYSSFSEFFSIFWEALHNTGVMDHESDVESLITELPTASQVEELAENGGLEEVSSVTRIEEFDFESGEQFLNAPLIADFLMKNWLASIPEKSRPEVSEEITRIINEERHEGEFALTVKATLVIGKKSRVN
jgi:ubiquinone/menaquinone biosynthesis C-methylase UbiE